jgi:hypothetical protein
MIFSFMGSELIISDPFGLGGGISIHFAKLKSLPIILLVDSPIEGWVFDRNNEDGERN